jgi:Sulfotransferase family/Protein of unknown function (DUF1232)
MKDERYQSTGRRKPRAAMGAAPAVRDGVLLRSVAVLAPLVLAALYWVWPNDLIPDHAPMGRVDDISVAFACVCVAARAATYRPKPSITRRGNAGDLRAGGVRQLELLAATLAEHGPPVIVYNAAHSGSRLLTRMLAAMGVYMGANLSDSEDSLDMAELVEHIVLGHAPDYARLFAEGDPALDQLAITAVTEHLAGRPPHARWGWKNCETGHALPVIARLFPRAQVIHLIRDGRDVAFSPFVAPKHPYWRKIYFGFAELRSWRGLAMTQRAYRAHGPLFNANRWVNSVTLGRGYGAMLGERYCEVRYEDVVADPRGAAARIAAFLGLPAPGLSIEALGVESGRVGKWRALPEAETAEVLQLLAPTLTAFSYGAALTPKTGAPLGANGATAD